MCFYFFFFVWFGQTIVNWAGREPMHASLGLCFWAVRRGWHVEWSPVGCGVHRFSGNYCRRGSRHLSVLAFRPAVLFFFFLFTFLLGLFAFFAVDLFSVLWPWFLGICNTPPLLSSFCCSHYFFFPPNQIKFLTVGLSTRYVKHTSINFLRI